MTLISCAIFGYGGVTVPADLFVPSTEVKYILKLTEFHLINFNLEYIKLGNLAAEANNFKTLDDLWLFPWETADFKQQIEALWQEIKPYYVKFHAYVRMRLRAFYGASKMPSDGTIPAHLTGKHPKKIHQIS